MSSGTLKSSHYRREHLLDESRNAPDLVPPLLERTLERGNLVSWLGCEKFDSQFLVAIRYLRLFSEISAQDCVSSAPFSRLLLPYATH